MTAPLIVGLGVFLYYLYTEAQKKKTKEIQSDVDQIVSTGAALYPAVYPEKPRGLRIDEDILPVKTYQPAPVNPPAVVAPARPGAGDVSITSVIYVPPPVGVTNRTEILPPITDRGGVIISNPWDKIQLDSSYIENIKRVFGPSADYVIEEEKKRRYFHSKFLGLSEMNVLVGDFLRAIVARYPQYKISSTSEYKQLSDYSKDFPVQSLQQKELEGAMLFRAGGVQAVA